jgi:hypothetical protein
MSIRRIFAAAASCAALIAATSLAACSSAPTNSNAAPAASDAVLNAQLGDLTIRGAWARPTMAAGAHDHGSSGASSGMNSAAYMVIENKGAAADRLIDVASDAAKMVQFHQTSMKDGVMKMEHLPDGAEIPAGGSLVLKPASYHVMLMDAQKLAPGASIKVTLAFEKAGSITIDVPVREP